jgi:uncharacterized protein with PhoU and TrkA domain
MQGNKWIKLIGDNLDFRISTAHQTSDAQHQDRHCFTSVVRFSNIPDVLSDTATEISPLLYDNIQPESVVDLDTVWKNVMLAGYKVVLGRILSEHLEAFGWLKRTLPKHLPHR